MKYHCRILYFLLVCALVAGCAPVMAPGPYWVENEVIVTGPADEIDQIVSELADLENIALEPLPLCDQGECLLNDLFTGDDDPRLIEEVLGRRPTPEQLGQLVMRLYATGGLPVEDVVDRIHDLGAQEGRFVFADPNYFTAATALACATPHSVGNGPHGLPGGTAKATWFKGQRAFIKIADSPTVRSIDAIPRGNMGETIAVGVFDTSPFADTDGTPIGTTGMQLVDVGYAQPVPLSLRVSHLASLPAITGSTAAAAAKNKEHGLFVAGLIHALAPQSEVYLIRILNDAGCGTVATLNAQLNEFRNLMKTLNHPLNRVVINLSLGIVQPVPATVASTALVTLGKKQNGVVIVAAAGNDSATGLPLVDMQWPASYNFVVGVAASTFNNQRACYSNRGDIAAPGGDSAATTCAPNAHQCNNGTCPYGVISLVTKANSSTGYAFWAGTSFAAPLVSGMAAVGLSNDCASTGVNSVVERIKASAAPAPPPASPLESGWAGSGLARFGFACP